MKPYPPAWSIIPQAFVRKERWLGGYKVAGTPLVSPGQDVVPDQPILRWSSTEKSFTGQPSRAFTAGAPSQEVIPAGLRGRVIEITSRGGVVIESHATLVQGVIGVGNQVVGILTLWRPDSTNQRQTIPPSAILVVPDPLNFMFLRQSVASGVVGIVSSSIALKDLEGFLHADLIAFLQEERTEQRMLLQQHFPRLTLLFTQGLGHAKMPAKLVDTLSQYEGSIALLSGETSLRNGIVPELIISLPANDNPLAPPAAQPDTLLIPGAQVRVHGGEQQGITGTIDYLFAYEQKFPSGLSARAARLRLEDGSFLVVPLFSLERIG
jgi:hypothetical protein